MGFLWILTQIQLRVQSEPNGTYFWIDRHGTALLITVPLRVQSYTRVLRSKSYCIPWLFLPWKRNRIPASERERRATTIDYFHVTEGKRQFRGKAPRPSGNFQGTKTICNDQYLLNLLPRAPRSAPSQVCQLLSNQLKAHWRFLGSGVQTTVWTKALAPTIGVGGAYFSNSELETQVQRWQACE